jgi:hypothetical protein
MQSLTSRYIAAARRAMVYLGRFRRGRYHRRPGPVAWPVLDPPTRRALHRLVEAALAVRAEVEAQRRNAHEAAASE